MNNNISFNTAGGWGGAINCYENNKMTKISDNFICNNSAYGAGGIAIVSCDSLVDVSNNVVTNNSTTSSSGMGGGIDYNGNEVTLMNNTITNNSTGGHGGGVSFSYSTNAVFLNCILYGNTAAQGGSQIYLFDEASDPDFYFCDIEGGASAFDLNGNFYTGTYQNNIDTNPLFVSPSGGSGTAYNGFLSVWSLQTLSPCIDTGDPNGTYPPTDIAGNPRVAGSFIDIGAYEYQGNTGVTDYDSQEQAIVYPNPFSISTTIKLGVGGENSELSIYNLFGQKAGAAYYITKEGIKVLRGDLNSGIYFYVLKQNNKPISNGKLIITR